jgi:hypothetical protein
VSSSWYRVTLSDEDVIARRHMELQQAFETIFLAHRWPSDAAMFSGIDTLTHDFYFSPSAVRMAKDILKHYSATPCPPPAPSDIVLLVGTPDWKPSIFPTEP